MAKILLRETIKSTPLRKRFLENINADRKKSYNKQINLCVTLLSKQKRQYFCESKLNRIINNKIFWQTVKPYFPEQRKCSERITLLGKKELVTQDKNLADSFNFFFQIFSKILKYQNKNIRIYFIKK